MAINPSYSEFTFNLIKWKIYTSCSIAENTIHALLHTEKPVLQEKKIPLAFFLYSLFLFDLTTLNPCHNKQRILTVQIPILPIAP
jgi:hypothetical protein